MSGSGISLGFNRYGKSNVRFLRVDKSSPKHVIKELRVEILLEGDFAKSFQEADNSQIVPTETQKNTLYVLSKKYPVEPVERWGLLVAQDLMSRHSHISAVSMHIEEQPWERVVIQGRQHNHAFQKGVGLRFADLRVVRGGGVDVASGFQDVSVLKTAQSGFVGYIKDEYTTLGETKDRVLSTTISCHWKYARTDQSTAEALDYTSNYTMVRDIVMEGFAGPPDTGRFSASVQRTVYEIGEAALSRIDTLSSLTMRLPNIHFYPVDFTDFRTNLVNRGEVFLTYDGAHGLIEATVERTAQRSRL